MIWNVYYRDTTVYIMTIPSSPCRNVVWCSGDIKAWLSSHMISGCLQLRWDSLGQRSALSGFCLYLVLGQVLDSILSLVRCTVYLWDGEVLLSLCPGLNCCPTAVPSLRSGGSVSFWPCALHSCFPALPHLPVLHAKSYNIVGRREFCCLELF